MSTFKGDSMILEQAVRKRKEEHGELRKNPNDKVFFSFSTVF